MHEQEHMIEGAGTHIWLHYATTVMVNGRPRTIEMGIPVPTGADDALREQLLREANAGMNQLIGSVENRVAQLLHQVPPTQGAIPTPTPAAKPSVTPPPRPRPTTPSNAPAPTSSSVSDIATPSRPPTQPQQITPPYNAPQTPQRHEVRENRENRENREAREIRETREPERESERERERVSEVVPPSDATSEQIEQPVRQTMNLPSMREISANVSLPQFIQYINEHLGLNPKQAMEILKVKSLSGINLRDALEQLQRSQGGQNDADGAASVGERGRAGTTETSTKAMSSANGQNGQRAERAERVERIEGDERPSKPETRNNNGQQASPPKQPIPFRPAGGKIEESRANPKVVRESPAAYFDEEDDENDSDIGDELDELLDDGDEEEQQGLTPQERVQASGLVSRLRESQGVATVNPARLKVLGNVTDGQIDEAQLVDLIQGLWGITATKRLKVDQAEALISWAKEDDFQNEAEIVLLFLEEDALARGNR